MGPHVIEWNLTPATDFPSRTALWDAINDLGSGSALLQARFVTLLLRFFGHGRMRLGIATDAGTPVAMSLIEPARPLVWTSIQPAQAPLGLWLTTPDLDHGQAARALLRSLPGSALLLGLQQQDPRVSSRPRHGPGLRTLDYIHTARISADGTFEDYWTRRGKNLRHNLRRQLNRLEREGIQPRLEVTTRPEAMAAAVADYGRLESAGWKTRTGTAVAADNVQGAFYRALLETYAQTGDALVYRFFYNERLVAIDLCIHGSGTLNWLKTTYDETQTTSSPAALLRQASFRLAFADARIAAIEFYGPVMDWHTKWAEDFRTMYHINCYRWPWLAPLHEHQQHIRQALTRRAAQPPCPPCPTGGGSQCAY
jgi:CelD/BcsL family acetyltransferase involved in cellulose biosynthesis